MLSAVFGTILGDKIALVTLLLVAQMVVIVVCQMPFLALYHLSMVPSTPTIYCIHGNNTSVSLPTGYSKSLYYFLHPLCLTC